MQVDAQIREKIRQGRRHKAGAGRFFPKAFNPYYRTFITTYYLYFILEILVLKMNQVEAVPDPAPTLLDSNFVEPNNLQLLFRPSGQYAASTHLVHVRVPFNFSQVLATPNEIFLEYRNYVEILVLKMNQVEAVPDPAPTLLDSNFVEPQISHFN